MTPLVPTTNYGALDILKSICSNGIFPSFKNQLAHLDHIFQLPKFINDIVCFQEKFTNVSLIEQCVLQLQTFLRLSCLLHFHAFLKSEISLRFAKNFLAFLQQVTLIKASFFFPFCSVTRKLPYILAFVGMKLMLSLSLKLLTRLKGLSYL